MGIALPQVVTSDRASGAQVIDGSLKIIGDNDAHLTRTLGATGSTSCTFSLWVKRGDQGAGNNPAGYESFVDAYISSATYTRLFFNGNSLAMGHRVSNNENYLVTTAKFRDTGWYHIVGTSDSNGHPSVYVNGVQYTDYSASSITFNQTSNAATTSGTTVEIGTQNGRTDRNFDGLISNFYFIDGQALDASYFGYTDPLTNTWRPKKYEGTFGTNGFYLPMDGNSPIGEDKSGKGNNWTPVNFGGSVALDKATGAKPILNTDGGGNVARPGVFGSEVGAYYAVTVSNPGSGNKYYLDGVLSANPTLTRGATYTFDQSDSSNSGHPLVFGTTAEGNNYSDGVTTNGTPGSAGAYTKITVPHNAPDTLYYHCSVHSGMGSSTSQITDETKADIYAWKNVLALPLVGSANDLSNSVNSGTTTKTTTVSGATASNAESNIYGGSFLFDGSNDEITVGGVSDDLDFGTGDYTAEAWFYLTATGDEYILNFNTDHGGSSPHWGINIYSTNLIRAGRTNSSGDASHSVTHPFITNKWYHVAISRSGGISRLFLDGNLLDSESNSDDIDPTSDLKLGRHSAGGSIFYNGYIQDVRIYKGVGKYTNSFVVPSTSPDILPDTPSGVSGGSKLAKVTDGAVAFDGSGDGLTLGTSSDFTFGSVDFTIEMIIYPTEASGSKILFENDSTGNANGVVLARNSSQQIFFYVNGNGAYTSSQLAPNNVWTHVALVRDGTAGTTKIYINGVGDTSNSNDAGTTNNGVFIGSRNSGASLVFGGIISNVRVLKGTALYTANFTPPTRELTNVTNTKLLCCQSNTSANLAGVSPATFSNDGTIWSNTYTGSNSFQATAPATNGFDGNITTRSACSTGGCTVTFTPPTAITVSSSLRVYAGYGSASVSGGSAVSFSGSAVGWQDLSFTGSLTSLAVTGNPSGGNANAGEIYAVEVDGCILVDGLAGEAIASAGNAAATNFNPFTTDINAVRGQETGYATLNPLDTSLGSNLQDGNLKTVGSSNWSVSHVRGTFKMTSGKWFWEGTKSGGGGAVGQFGFANTSASLTESYSSAPANSWTFYFGNGTEIIVPAANSGGYFSGSAMTNGDTAGVALDMDNGTWQFFKNGVGGAVKTLSATDSGSTASITELYPYVGSYNSNFDLNFGQKPFKFPPPAGFQPLNAANVRPVKVITRPDQYVGVTTYSGDGGSSRSIPIGFQADLAWFKIRNDNYYNRLVDSVRGVGKALQSDRNVEEQTETGGVLSFGYNDIKLGTDTAYNGTSSRDLVLWTWKAGGSKNTFNVDDVGYASAAAAGLDGGTLTITGSSVGTKQGFSIITYNGAFRK